MREKMERHFDKYNHFMEFVRTITGITVLGLQVIILMKLFGLFQMITRKNKYSIGFWITKIIKSCNTDKQLEVARQLLFLFENSLKYDPPYELIREIYTIYSEQQRLIMRRKNNVLSFDPDIHL